MRAEAAIDQSPCNGCTECRHRCTEGIRLTRSEYDAIRAYLAGLPPEKREAVLSQEHTRPWPGAKSDATYEACRFLDLRNGLCLVYPVRPLICRLFGHVEWLPCPIGRIEHAWPGGPAAMAARAPFEQRTYDEWSRHDDPPDESGGCADKTG